MLFDASEKVGSVMMMRRREETLRQHGCLRVSCIRGRWASIHRGNGAGGCHDGWVVWAVQCSTVLASALALSVVMTSVADLAMDTGVLSARDQQESRSWS
ncbi:hypothetical protein N9C62_01750 [Luminiphilus sp.]|nr:hypothetical protein [Luminiphilus sp.]